MEDWQLHEAPVSMDGRGGGGDDDFEAGVLAQLSNSTDEDHQRICAVLGAMAHELKDQNIPLSPIAYLGATCSSLERLAADSSSSHTVDALLGILSLLLPRVSNGILLKKAEFLSGLVSGIVSSKKALAEGGVASSLRCVSRLIMIRRGNVGWADVSLLYSTLVSFVTDARPKVRRQAHASIRDVLQHFHRVPPVLSPASEGITNILERSLLLAGGSNASNSAADGPKGAQDVLFVLDSLKECLPFMSPKYTTSILKYYKTLLELGQPLVTRRIMDSLMNLISLRPSEDEFAPEALLDLLCSLALSASSPSSKTSADSMTFTCRLLAAGMERVYALNRNISVVKLPIMFTALKDILGLEHEEAVHASMEALKKLIRSCIDESMVKQGADRFLAAEVDSSLRKSKPTTIEKLCAITESLLHYRFRLVWDMSFQVVSALFEKLGVESYYLMRGTIKNLSELQMLPDENFPFRKQLHECIGSAVGAMGPEMLLSLIPLNVDAEDQSESNIWLFPILKHYTVGSKLSFYCNTILPMIGPLKRRAQKLESEGHMFSSRTTEGLVYSLWSLFPSFCNYPSDTAESFNQLEKPLCQYLREQADVRGLICAGLHLLIEQNKELLEGRINDPSEIDLSASTRRAMAQYTEHVASENLRVLASSARNLLSVLSEIFLESTKDEGCLQSLISEITSIAPEEVVSTIFIRIMRNLLKKTQIANSSRGQSVIPMNIDSSETARSLSHQRAQLLDLAASFLPKLNADQINVLYTALEPLLQEDEGIIQKKAYKVLSILFKNCGSFLSSKHSEMLTLMVNTLPFCHFSAKRHRLDCLYFLIVHYSKISESEKIRPEVISSFLTEIILALKEANKKTRNRAYEMLVQIAHVYGDEDKGGKKENLQRFFNMVAGGMAGETPHMISAAVKGLARLAYEFSDLVSTAYNVLPSAYLLLQRKNKEIIKANLGLLKVLVAKSPAEGLHAHLNSMVQGLLNWPDDSKKHFKAKIKLLLEMLVKKCGLDAVKAVMPEEHMKLLANIRKLKDRKERKLAAGSEESQSRVSRATTSRLSRWNHTRIFSDFDDETEGSDGDARTRPSKASSLFDPKAPSLRSKRLRKAAAKSLPEDMFDQMDEDEPLDLLDRQKTRSSLRASGQSLKRKSESDDDFELDTQGRLIINEQGIAKNKKSSEDYTDTRSRGATSVHSASSLKLTKRRKLSESSRSYVGSEYASKKAGGDLKKKDKLEPYAYWPLDRKMLSRKGEQYAAAKRGMASVVKLAKNLQGISASSALSISGRKFKDGHKKKKSKAKN
uniref:RRP12-like protein n=1 Tax=Kalanchoe fedtschenkoi TaxID=63787 RepID=A0A7N0UJ95_KALFE